MGVQEYRFIFDHGKSLRFVKMDRSVGNVNPFPGRTVGQEWRLYDVGGTRSSVSASLLHTLSQANFCMLSAGRVVSVL